MSHAEHHRSARRLHHPPHNDGVPLTPFSAPVSATPEATTNTQNTTTNMTTNSSSGNFHQQREAQLRHALQHASPTTTEVSAVASAAYVQALMELIDQHAIDVQQVSTKIDALQTQRERYHADLAARALRTENEMQTLRNECSDLTLQLQEERERSTRLLHETTVLHTCQAEQRAQVGQLVELCRARGRRLRTFYHHTMKSSNNNINASGGGSRAVDSGEEAGRCEASPEQSSSAAARPNSPLSRLNASAAAAAHSPPPPPPPSLSISKAACTTPARGISGNSSHAFSLADIGDDAEVAAILGLPYTVQQSRSGALPSPTAAAAKEGPAPGAGAAAVTVTANTAATAHLLALTEEVNMLRHQLEEQRGTYEHERGIRTQEDNTRHREAQEQLTSYAATVQHLEALHEESLRELVVYRHRTDKQLRDVRGQVEWLRVALQDALALAEKDRRRQHNEVYATEQRMSRQYYPKVQSLHSELAEYRRNAAAQAKDFAAALAEKDARIADLQQKVKAEVTQRGRVEQRYKLEMAGVHSELDMMRQALRQMERRVYYRGVRETSFEAGEGAEEAVESELERYYR